MKATRIETLEMRVANLEKVIRDNSKIKSNSFNSFLTDVCIRVFEIEDINELLSRSDTELVMVRAFCYLTYQKYTGMSLKSIGLKYNRRLQSVRYGLDNIDSYAKSSPLFRKQVKEANRLIDDWIND